MTHMFFGRLLLSEDETQNLHLLTSSDLITAYLYVAVDIAIPCHSNAQHFSLVSM